MTTRTGHGSSQIVALYGRQANTVVELKLTWFMPLHEIVPELAALGSVPMTRSLNGAAKANA